jgi:hypothetical protein
MGYASDAGLSFARSVFVLSRPVRLLGFQVLSSVPTIRYWGILVCPLIEEELQAAICSVTNDDTPLGGIWEFRSIYADKFEVRATSSFSIRDTKKLNLLMEYCGKTVMTDEAITDEGQRRLCSEKLILSGCYHRPISQL